MSLPLPPDDPFLPYLRFVLDRNFPTCNLALDPSIPIIRPISFHDRHIGSHLILKRVRIIPSLHQNIANSIMEPLRKFTDSGFKFDSSKYLRFSRSQPSKPMEQAASVGRGYHDIFGAEMTRLVSKIIFTPEIPEWIQLVGMSYGGNDSTPGFHFLSEGYASVNTNGSELYLTGYEREKLPDAAAELALDLDGVYDCLASWSFVPNTKKGKSVVSAMSSMLRFDWEGGRTSDPLAHSTTLPTPPDAPSGFAVEEIVGYLAGRRKAAEPKSFQQSISKKRDVKLATAKPTGKYIPTSKDYIQAAWAVAVRKDTTYIIFNCGSHERIGIRHRASQTLYLSGLIDTTKCSPAYGRVQLGLHLAIIQDAIARKDARKKFNKKNKVSLKRDAQHLDSDKDMRPMKRIKRGSEDPPAKLLNAIETYEVSKAEEEMSKRSLLLVNLKYGDFDSPSPSTFLRLGGTCVRGLFTETFTIPKQRSTYKSEHYMTATLRSPIGSGAIGTAHRATLTVSGPSGKTLQRSCLVKLAISPDSQRALEHEFAIYRHLAKMGNVSGVVRVHGLFRDTQTGTLALVMDYGGYSLRRWEREVNKDFDDEYLVVEKDEWEAVLKALQQLHTAGVCHNDVRIDNIVINDANEVALIDFDRATFSAKAADHEKDVIALQDLLYLRDEEVSEGE